VCLSVVVLSDTMGDKLRHRLLRADQHRDLLSIPVAHYLGQTLQVEIKLALRKIIKLVSYSYEHSNAS